MTKSKLIKSIAMWCVARATQETTTGNLIIGVDEIETVFEISHIDLQEIIEDIFWEIDGYECVSDINMYWNKDQTYVDRLDINLYTDYCFNDIE